MGLILGWMLVVGRRKEFDGAVGRGILLQYEGRLTCAVVIFGVVEKGVFRRAYNMTNSARS